MRGLAACAAWVAATCVGVPGALGVADVGVVSAPSHIEGRALVEGPRGLALEDAWVAEVSGEQCPAVRARIEAWRQANQTQSLRGAPRHLGGARIRKSCWVFFDGPRQLADFVRAHVPHVLLVEPNLVVSAARYVSGDPPSWGLNRVDQPSLPLSSGVAFTEAFDGKGQTVYVVDTGLNEMHDQFITWRSPTEQSGRRSRRGADFVNEPDKGDGHGHGTHCAGTAAGGSFGVAPGASVVGVKSIGATGSGLTSAVVEGIAWATQDSAGKAAVISLSLGNPANGAIDGAVRAAASAGMIVVVAAGNFKADACKYSPARVGGKAATTGVITVGATDRTDQRAWFSNYGKCVDMFAPGYAILSAWKGGPSATRFISGTSQATPHVAGAAAVLLQKHAGDRAAALAELLASAAVGKVKDAKGSRNRLLQVPQPAAQSTPGPTMPPTVPLPTICVKGAGGAIVACADNGFEAGVFGPVFSPTATKITGMLAVATTDLCLPSQESYSGKIVLVARGGCLFYQKTMAAQKAGAKAVVVYNSDDLDPFPPNYSGGAVAPTIMTFMIYRRDGLALAKLAGQTGLTVVIG
jgi:hypothetical protein